MLHAWVDRGIGQQSICKQKGLDLGLGANFERDKAKEATYSTILLNSRGIEDFLKWQQPFLKEIYIPNL